jgi:serine/threonine protein kinase
VKTSNILIDENMVAKVADFGISKQTPEGIFSGVDTLLKGTPGYFDPEYFITQRLTQKSDVYSFGVVLLELISGRHPHVADLPDGTSGTILQWVRSSVDNERLLDIVDPSLKGEFNLESMIKVISLAIRCIELVSAPRPDMKQVVRVITEAIELEVLSEIIIKGDKDTNAPVAEGKESDSEFNFERSEVPVFDHSDIVLQR